VRTESRAARTASIRSGSALTSAPSIIAWSIRYGTPSVRNRMPAQRGAEHQVGVIPKPGALGADHASNSGRRWLKGGPPFPPSSYTALPPNRQGSAQVYIADPPPAGAPTRLGSMALRTRGGFLARSQQPRVEPDPERPGTLLSSAVTGNVSPPRPSERTPGAVRSWAVKSDRNWFERDGTSRTFRCGLRRRCCVNPTSTGFLGGGGLSGGRFIGNAIDVDCRSPYSLQAGFRTSRTNGLACSAAPPAHIAATKAVVLRC